MNMNTFSRRTFLGATILAGVAPRASFAHSNSDTLVFVSDYVLKAAPAPGSYDIQIEPLYGNAEFLMRPTREGPQPWLAEAIEQLEPTKWRITLKPGITFQNGRPLDAKALKGCLDYYLTSKENQGDPGAALMGNPTSIDVSGSLSVDLTLPKPFPRLPFAAAHYAYLIFDPEAVAAVNGDWSKLVDKGIFTGPFTWETIEPGKITYKRYDNYWGGKPHLASVTIKQVPDEQAGLQAISAGEADVLAYPALSLAAAARGMPNTNYVVIDGVGFIGLYPEPHIAPFDDVKVRKALSLAIDNDAIAKGVGLGLGTAMKGWFPAESPLEVDWVVHDPAKAEALLEEAGWKKDADGIRAKDGKQLEARFYCYTAIGEGVATASADMAKKVGFLATVRRFEHYSDIPAVQNVDGGIYTMYTESFGLNGDPQGTMFSVLGGGYGVKAFDDIKAVLDPVMQSTDQSEIDAAMKKAQEINGEHAYWLPIMDDKARFILSDRFKHVALNPFYIFADAKMAPEA
ncbi:ABC transporter substrate-binding protein [Dongia sp.]|uniref:ABC transporter substrate-binding protein n=1 Tax=Dongia sp. TaxID=1977262 RepID=UPI0035B03BB6